MATATPCTVRWFDDLGLQDRPSVGGKGASLGELLRAGAAIPPGCVVSTVAFERFLRSVDSDGRIRRRIEALVGKDAVAIQQACASIRQELEQADLPPEVEAEIAAAYERLGGGAERRPVAVRSSATSEDHLEASFAGLQDTFLWIRGVDDVIASIKRCWSSLYSVESVTYRLRLGLPEDEVAMAVVVQEMVDARCAGVMFTRSPLTGDKSVIAIEAAWGLGSAVVSGEVTPDRYVINKITGEIVHRTVSHKTVQHIPDAAGGMVVEVALNEDQRDEPCLSDDEVRQLATVAKGIERHYGQPQDIEWAIDRRAKGSAAILLLQARPETVWSAQDRDKKPRIATAANPMEHVLRTLTDRSGRR